MVQPNNGELNGKEVEHDMEAGLCIGVVMQALGFSLEIGSGVSGFSSLEVQCP